MRNPSIAAERLPEHARVRIQGGLRGHTIRVSYGEREVTGVTAAYLSIRGGQARAKAILEYLPQEAKEKGDVHLREQRQVELDAVDVEAIADEVHEEPVQGESDGVDEEMPAEPEASVADVAEADSAASAQPPASTGRKAKARRGKA